MWQSREHPRQLTLRTARIVSGEDESGIHCAVLNSSAGGLCLLVASAEGIPSEFDLIVDADGSRRACAVVWTSDNRIGVRFK
jgi:hypothetical protein